MIEKLGGAINGAPAPRTDEQVAFGVIPCRVGRELRYMRTLKIRQAPAWKDLLGRTLVGRVAGFDLPALVSGNGGKAIEALIGLGNLGSEVVLELVVAYDRDGALGGSEWLGENADDLEVYAIFRQILAVHYPFARDVLSLTGAVAGLMASGAQETVRELLSDASSSTPSSSNGPSPSGAPAPTRSPRRSTKRN